MTNRPMTNEELTAATRALLARVEKLEETLSETSQLAAEGFKTLAEHLIAPAILRKLKVKLVKDEPATGDGEGPL